jgi:phage terminase small subunit
MNKLAKKEMGELIEGLTPKQAKFFALWLESGNGTKAALEAYDTDDYFSAAAIATENLKKIKNPMKLYLERNGISVSHLSKVVTEAMGATKTDITGDVHPDHRIRLEAADRLAKWLGVEQKDEITNQTNQQFNFIISRGEDDGTDKS